MKLIIHINKGMLYGVYHQREEKDAVTPMGVPDVVLVDTDCEDGATEVQVEDLKDADSDVIEAVGAKV